MADRTQTSYPFPRSARRKVEATFSGGHITSDGGLLLVRQAERQLGVIRRIARQLPDDRRHESVRHDVASMLKQRIFGLACGYEDQSDHDQLRHDLAVQAIWARTRRSPTRRRCIALRTARTGAGRGPSTACSSRRSWLRLIKVGAVIIANTRRVRFLLTSSHPDQELFWLVASKLAG